MKNQFHDVRMTQMELVFCYLLFYDGVDFIQLFFGEKQPGRAAVSVLFHLVYSSDLDCVTRREPQWGGYAKLYIKGVMKSFYKWKE